MLLYKYSLKSLELQFPLTSTLPCLDIEHFDRLYVTGFRLQCLLLLNILVQQVVLPVTILVWRFYLKTYSSGSLFVSISDGPRLPTVLEYLDGSDESFSKTVKPFLSRLSFAKVACS